MARRSWCQSAKKSIRGASCASGAGRISPAGCCSSSSAWPRCGSARTTRWERHSAPAPACCPHPRLVPDRHRRPALDQGRARRRPGLDALGVAARHHDHARHCRLRAAGRPARAGGGHARLHDAGGARHARDALARVRAVRAHHARHRRRHVHLRPRHADPDPAQGVPGAPWR